MSMAPFGSEARPVHPDRLPTLTEVLELGRGEGAAAEAVPSRPETPVLDWPGSLSPLPPAPAIDDGVSWGPPPLVPAPLPVASARALAQVPDANALVALVMAELTPRLELLFEARVREAVAPALARAADLLIREARPELSAALRELVAETVSRVLERRTDP